MVVTRVESELGSAERGAVSGVVRFEFDSGVTPPTVALVQSLSKVMGVGPTDIRPLASSVDTDALDDLMTPREDVDAAVEVAVTHHGYGITVDNHGTITVVSDNRDQAEDTR